MLEYPVAVHPFDDEEGGGWLAEFPDLPGCMADGETPEEALKEAEDAVASHVATLRELGRPVPQPSGGAAGYSGRWVVRVPRSLHGRLAERPKQEGVSLFEVGEEGTS